MPIYTHNVIKLDAGVLGIASILWGGNAIQTVTIGRHSPRNPNQAVGYLGVIDWSRSVITSDVSLDCILTEQSAAAAANASAYQKSKDSVTIGTETYVLTNCGIGFTAGNAATVSYGYLTATIASALDVSGNPDPVVPDNNGKYPFAVVMGDDGHGIKVVAYGANNTALTPGGNIPYIDANGALQANGVDDGGIPFGLASLNFAARINRENVLDIRSSSPVQFVSSYPLDITIDMEIYTMPGATFRGIKGLEVLGAGYTNDDVDSGEAANKMIAKALGIVHQDEQETAAVGRYRQYTANFNAAELWLPIEQTA